MSKTVASGFNDTSGLGVRSDVHRARDFAPLPGRPGVRGSLTRDISHNGRTHGGGDDGPGATASSPADKAAG